MQEEISKILYQYSYLKIYLLGSAYLLSMYMMAPCFLGVCKILYKKKVLQKIVDRKISVCQIRYEVIHSLGAILVFGFAVLPIVYLIREGIIHLLPSTVINIIIGVVIMTIWNEVHFVIVHRIMHLPFFMRHVHVVHHQSKIPTVYSVYSFHWFEAFLISTLSLTIMLFVPFSPVAVFLYPLVNLIFNCAGHCNYRFGNGVGHSWLLFGTNHNDHHAKAKKNYGFVLNPTDRGKKD
ncbi:MAG: sterol desaturase family protein [Cyclobacteriaceae bacterium]|nr:sterol desaturase family protein [Cyclobacteriaceae bacterium]